MSASDATAETFLLNLRADAAPARQLADALELGFAEEPPAISLFEIDKGACWELKAYFQHRPEQTVIEKMIAGIDPRLAFTLEPLQATDWVSKVQSELAPVCAGRFFVYGSHDRHRASGRSGDVEIDAGQAFGTAHHATTRGCLLALDSLFKRAAFNTILDLGAGTGVLAIAAARVLRQPVIASDIDATSVQVARENAENNQVGPLVRVVEAAGLAHRDLRQSSPYDLIIANILAAPLKQLAPGIAKVMAPGGYLVLSGLLGVQSPTIEARYRNFGFRMERRIPLDEWMTLILRRDA